MPKTSLTKAEQIALALDSVHALVWDELKQIETLIKFCNQMQFGRLQMTVHGGVITEVIAEVHYRKETPKVLNLNGFEQAMLEELKALPYLDVLCREMKFGEIHILAKNGLMNEVWFNLRLRANSK